MTVVELFFDRLKMSGINRPVIAALTGTTKAALPNFSGKAASTVV